MKHYIGNGSKGQVFVTFAATGEDSHTAFIVEAGMEGFEVGRRFDTLGLRGQRPARAALPRRAGAA